MAPSAGGKSPQFGEEESSHWRTAGEAALAGDGGLWHTRFRRGANVTAEVSGDQSSRGWIVLILVAIRYAVRPSRARRLAEAVEPGCKRGDGARWVPKTKSAGECSAGR
jgi:hypothetical protein